MIWFYTYSNFFTPHEPLKSNQIHNLETQIKRIDLFGHKTVRTKQKIQHKHIIETKTNRIDLFGYRTVHQTSNTGNTAQV